MDDERPVANPSTTRAEHHEMRSNGLCLILKRLFDTFVLPVPISEIVLLCSDWVLPHTIDR